MNELAYVAAAGIAALFAWAGRAKLRSRARTTRSFRAIGLPVPGALAIGVPVVELVLALTLLVVPAVAATATIALLAAFTVVLARIVLAGREVSCACFGSAGSETVTWVELARNGALISVALVIAITGTTPVVPGIAALIAAGTVAATLAVLLALADLKQRTGAVLALRLTELS